MQIPKNWIEWLIKTRSYYSFPSLGVCCASLWDKHGALVTLFFSICVVTKNSTVSCCSQFWALKPIFSIVFIDKDLPPKMGKSWNETNNFMLFPILRIKTDFWYRFPFSLTKTPSRKKMGKSWHETNFACERNYQLCLWEKNYPKKVGMRPIFFLGQVIVKGHFWAKSRVHTFSITVKNRKKQFHYTKGHFQLYHLRHTIQSEKWSFQKSQFPNPSARRSLISDSGKLTVSRAHQLLFAGGLFAAIPSQTMCQCSTTMCQCSTALQHCVVVAGNRKNCNTSCQLRNNSMQVRGGCTTHQKIVVVAPLHVKPYFPFALEEAGLPHFGKKNTFMFWIYIFP